MMTEVPLDAAGGAEALVEALLLEAPRSRWLNESFSRVPGSGLRGIVPQTEPTRMDKMISPPRQEENRALERSALIVATLTSFMGPFMMSSVNVALPKIQAELQMDAVQLSWIATAYLLAVAVGLVPAGKIADHWGRTRIFALGLAILAVEFAWARRWLKSLRETISNGFANNRAKRAEKHRDRVQN